ncbi:hypothetical protein ACRYCC_42705 [Actinomadura scrupuli]|uniref:hypothetical protein n=1 Tax=Actinomadura scrupuli TaxID=559629 RepID=UPI003D996BD7
MFGWLDGYGTTHNDILSQQVAIPAGCTSTLSFWLHVNTAETDNVAYDRLTVRAGNTVLATYSNLNAAAGYVLKSFNVSSLAGQTVTLSFTGSEVKYGICPSCHIGLLYKIGFPADWQFSGLGRLALDQLEARHPGLTWYTTAQHA